MRAAVLMHNLLHDRTLLDLGLEMRVRAAVHDRAVHAVQSTAHDLLDAWRKEVAEANQTWNREQQLQHVLGQRLMLQLADNAARDSNAPDALQTVKRELHCYEGP